MKPIAIGKAEPSSPIILEGPRAVVYLEVG